MSDLQSVLVENAIGLMVGTIVGGGIVRYLYRPRLKIEIDRVITHEAHSDTADRVFNLTIQVTNTGNVAGQNSVGFITLADVIASDLLEDDDPFPLEQVDFTEDAQAQTPYAIMTPTRYRPVDRELLCWAPYGNPARYTLNPGAKCVLEVAKAIWYDARGIWYLAVPSEEGWNRVRGRFTNRHLRGTLIVSPENGRQTTVDFEITLPRNGSTQGKPAFRLKRRSWWTRSFEQRA